MLSVEGKTPHKSLHRDRDGNDIVGQDCTCKHSEGRGFYSTDRKSIGGLDCSLLLVIYSES